MDILKSGKIEHIVNRESKQRVKFNFYIGRGKEKVQQFDFTCNKEKKTKKRTTSKHHKYKMITVRVMVKKEGGKEKRRARK